MSKKFSLHTLGRRQLVRAGLTPLEVVRMGTLSGRARRQPGFTLVEIIIAAAMISIALVSITLYYKKVLDVTENTTRHIQSGFLLEEGLEAAKLLRDESWNANIASLSTTTTYYLSWSGTFWRTTTTAQKVENTFTRSLKISDVRRDGTDNIAPTGTLDSGTKKISVFVSWPVKGGNGTATDTAETYITNLFSN